MQINYLYNVRLKGYQLLLLSVLGGCFLGISYPHSGSMFYLSFIAVVPLLIINFQLDKASRFKFLKRFGLAYLYFFLYNIITTWWIYNASPGGMYMAVFTNALLMSIPVLLTSFITKYLGESKGLIAFFVLWLSHEYGMYYGEISWPWLNFGHIFGETPKLIQWYEYSGVLGGTAWILVVNIICYIIIRNVWLEKESIKIQTPNLLSLFFAIVFPISWSLISYYGYEEKEAPVDIVIVQPNIDPYYEKFVVPANLQIGMMLTMAQAEVSSETDLIVFPETAIPYGLMEAKIDENAHIVGIQNFQKQMFNVPLMVGASTNVVFDKENSSASVPYGDRFYENYNSTLLVHPFKSVQIYHKDKPVLGGEKVPFIDWLPFLKKYSVELGGTSGVIGGGSLPIPQEASGLKFSPLICYESVYGEYTTYFTQNGADIICIITNDGWYDNTAGHKQHKAFARIRAIENRRSVARSANTGISCFINQRGDIIEELGWDKKGVLHQKINRNTELTFYVKWGDIIGRVSLFVAIGLIIYAISFALRRKKAGS